VVPTVEADEPLSADELPADAEAAGPCEPSAEAEEELSGNTEEAAAPEADGAIRLGHHVRVKPEDAGLVSDGSPYLHGVCEERHGETMLVRLEGNAFRIISEGGRLQSIIAVREVMVLTALLEPVTRRGEAEGAERPLDAEAAAAGMERIGLGLEAPMAEATAGASRLRVQAADRAPPPLPVRTLAFSLGAACELTAEHVAGGDQAALQTSLDGIVWWAARLAHDLPASACGELRQWTDRCRVSAAAFTIRPLEAAPAIEDLALELIDHFRDKAFEVLTVS